MNLHDIHAPAGANKNRKRIGRGPGSGTGKQAGKGHKGQNARSGGKTKVGFEGGQMPLMRRLPKFGFNPKFRKVYAEVNIAQLAALEGDVISSDTLFTCGVAREAADGVKVLGTGEISRAITLTVEKITEGARAKIEAAGGTVVLNTRLALPVQVDIAKAAKRVPGDVVDLEAVIKAGLAPEGSERLHLVKRGVLRKAKTFIAVRFSRDARRAITAVGGKIEEIG